MMRAKLFWRFCMKSRAVTIVYMIVLFITCNYTVNLGLGVSSTYYRWRPMKILDDNWYVYVPGDDYHVGREVTDHLIRIYGAQMVAEYRSLNSVGVGKGSMDMLGNYAGSYLCRLSEKDKAEILKEFPRPGEFRKVADVIAQECDWKTLLWVPQTLVCVLLWFVSIFCGVIWFQYCWRHMKQEICYLAYIGNDTKRMIRYYANPIFLFVPIIYTISLLAIAGVVNFMYGEMGFFEYTFPVLAFVLSILFMIVGMVYLYGRKCIKQEEMETMSRDVLGVQRIYIDDFAIWENLQLILYTKGFNRNMSETLAWVALREREMEYCGKREMSLCPQEEKIPFFEAQEELMGEKFSIF